jgi:hypothetical protein
MKLCRRSATARQNKAPQRFELRLASIDGRFQFCNIIIPNQVGTVARRPWRGNFRTQVKQPVLHASQYVVHSHGSHAAPPQFAAYDPDRSVRLVDCPKRFHAEIALGHSPAAEERRFSRVPGARINLGHNRYARAAGKKNRNRWAR